MTTQKVLPTSVPHTAPYWEAAQNEQLVVQYCKSCETPWFYPRLVCPSCLGTDFTWRPASGKGTLYTWIRINRPVSGWQNEPGYVVAMVALAEGPRMMANVLTEHPDQLQIDMPLTIVFEDRDGTMIPQFMPDLEAVHGEH